MSIFQTIFIYLIAAAILVVRPVRSVTEAELYPHSESEGFFFADDGIRTVQFTLSPFTMFNRTNWLIHISGNGVVGLGSALYTPSDYCLPMTYYAQRIMPFWADADNNKDVNGAKLTYTETTTPALLRKAQKDVITGFPQFRRNKINWIFIITWKNMPAHENYGSKRNTFQLVLATSPPHSFVIIYYNKIEWPPSDRWAVGFDFGGSRQLYKFPGICTTRSTFEYFTQNSNIGKKHPGKFVFKVESSLEEPDLTKRKGDQSASALLFQPRIISVMGNLPLLVRGLYVDDDANITCSFADPSLLRPSETKGIIANTDSEVIVICPVPYLYSLGKIAVNLLVSYQAVSAISLYKGHIYAVKEHELDPLPQIYINKTLEKSFLFSATWNPSSIVMEDVKGIDSEENETSSCQSLHEIIEIVVLEYNGKFWKELGSVTPPILNNGVHLSPLNMSIFNKMIKPLGKPLLRTFALKGKYTLKSGAQVSKLLPSNTILATEMIISQQETGNADGQNKTNGNMFDTICKSWYEKEVYTPTDTLPCPRTTDQAHNDWRFSLDRTPYLEILNPGVSISFIQSVPSPSGAGSQCTYDYLGRLLVSIPGAGRLHRRSPNNWKGYWAHYWQDVMPFLYCCRWSEFKESNCVSYYYSKRPADHGTEYVPPRPSRATGLSHVSTFDGLNYTQVGAGEYWLVKYEDSKDDISVHDDERDFKMQVKIEKLAPRLPMFDNKSINVDPYFINSAVIEDTSNGRKVKVQVSQVFTHIVVMVDGEFVNGNGLIERNPGKDEVSDDELYISDFTLYLDEVTVSLSRYKVLVSFGSGFSTLFMISGALHSSLNIIVAASVDSKGNTKGLLGDFDGDFSNDLKLSNGSSLAIVDNENRALTFSKDFGSNLIVGKNESLFTYSPGESYRDEEDPNVTPVTYIYSDEDLSVGLNFSFCNGIPECNYDYYATDDMLIAEAGMGAYNVYQEALRVATTVESQCELPPSLQNGHMGIDTLAKGSILTVSCNSGYAMHPENGTFICKDVNESIVGDSPRWMNPTSMEIMPALTCVTPTGHANMEIINATIASSSSTTSKPTSTTHITTIITITTAKSTTSASTGASTHASGMVPVSMVPLKAEFVEESKSSSGSNGVSGTEILVFLVVIVIAVIVIGVIIAEYPLCRPVRMYIINRVRPIPENDVEELEI